jgi:uncharacterized protein YoaH (UPF0181 family)
MSTITLPIWIFVLSFGVPCVSLLFLMGFLLRKVRHPEEKEFANLCLRRVEDQQATNQKFHSHLLRMQVDTIFNGLNAIIETERLKINALLNPNNNILFETKSGSVDGPKKEIPLCETQEEQQTAELTLEQQMVNIVSSGEDIEEIATELGLSQTEIDLAKRMRSSRESNQGRKLEAVA